MCVCVFFTGNERYRETYFSRKDYATRGRQLSSLLLVHMTSGLLTLQPEEPWEPVESYRTLSRALPFRGVAVCVDLGVMVVATGSSGRLLEVTKFPSGDADADAVNHLDAGGVVGLMAFFIPPNGFRPLLLVAIFSQEAVHVYDVVSKTFVGDLIPRGTVQEPYGIAAQMGLRGPSSVVAVSHAYRRLSLFSFCGGDRTWNLAREIETSFVCGRGLRFAAGGTLLCVANSSNNKGNLSGNLSMFGVEGGQLVHDISTEMKQPVDVEEVEGGWLVAPYLSPCLHFVRADGSGHACALQDIVKGGICSVPDYGIAVCHIDRVNVYERSSVLAMRRMAPARVAWMVAVVKRNLSWKRYSEGRG